MDEKDTQKGAPGAAAAGSAGSAPQETPQSSKLTEDVANLKKGMEELTQASAEILRLREAELRKSAESPIKEEAVNEEAEFEEIRQILEKPSEEAAKLMMKRSKKEKEYYQKLLKAKEGEIAKTVLSKVKNDLTLDSQVSSARDKVLKEYPHLSKQIDEVLLKGSRIFHSTPGTSIEAAVMDAAKQIHGAFAEFAENEKKKNNPSPEGIPPGAVSETSGKPNPPVKKEQGPVSGAPKNLDDYFEREKAREEKRKHIKV